MMTWLACVPMDSGVATQKKQKMTKAPERGKKRKKSRLLATAGCRQQPVPFSFFVARSRGFLVSLRFSPEDPHPQVKVSQQRTLVAMVRKLPTTSAGICVGEVDVVLSLTFSFLTPVHGYISFCSANSLVKAIKASEFSFFQMCCTPFV